MKNNWHTMTVVVTGAYGGIGTALTEELVTRGCNVYLVGRDEASLQALTNQLQQKRINDAQIVYYFQADLADKASIEELASRLNYATPEVNVLINNAGINHLGTLDNTSVEQMQQMLNVNLMAPIQLTQLLLPSLKKQQQARVINVGSVFGMIGYPGFSGYCSSKFALRGFSEALQRELADSSVSVGYFVARATKTALNDASIVAMNTELKTKVDEPEIVAAKIVDFIKSKSLINSVAWPEGLFIKLNALLPQAVSNSIKKQLPIIKRFATA